MKTNYKNYDLKTKSISKNLSLHVTNKYDILKEEKNERSI